MKWEKLGKIFDPTKNKFASNFYEFAQFPQALVFDDFVRIYFSTREIDNSGKLLSHSLFVDFNKSFTKIINTSTEKIVDSGGLGCFDEHGIFPMNVVRYKDKVYGYICGLSRRVSVPIESSIGMAISNDNGLTFKKIGDGPILTSSLYEPSIIGDPFVAIFKGGFHMWYIFCERWIPNAEKDGSPSRVYKIAHAYSDDGISWHRESKQIIPDKLNSDECQAIPTVVYLNNKYHMFFCYRQAIDFRKNRECSYRIGYAYSDDLVNWTRDDDNVGIDVSEDGWDSQMICYPHVFHYDGKVYMLYNGNEFGRFGFGLAVLKD